jgi:hypothetical protein
MSAFLKMCNSVLNTFLKCAFLFLIFIPRCYATNFVINWLALLLYIQEVPHLIISLEVWCLSWFYSVFLGKCRNTAFKIGYTPNLHNHHSIRCYITHTHKNTSLSKIRNKQINNMNQEISVLYLTVACL